MPTLFFPLLGSLLSGVGRLRGFLKGPHLTQIFMSLATIGSAVIGYFVLLTGKTYATTPATWIVADTLVLDWSFIIDPPAAVMLIVVTTISTVVHIYSISYMGNDPHLSRFMSYLSLFTFFMLLLVSSSHLVGLFLG